MEETLKGRFEAILQAHDWNKKYPTLNEAYYELMQAAYNMALPQWVPIGERLPEKTGHYIAFGSYTRDCPQKPMEATFFKKNNPKYCEWRNSDMSRMKNVTHWMPLPPNPKD